MKGLTVFTKSLGYDFKNPQFLIKALTHPSAIRQNTTPKLHYERLELLGDAILGFVIKDILFHKHPSYQEGQLSQKSAMLTSRESCYRVGVQMGIQDVMQISEGEEKNGGRMLSTNISNTLEALLGAIYLDSQSVQACKTVITNHWRDLLEIDDYREPKSTLQEWSQNHIRSLPEYTLLTTNGPEHKPNFVVEAKLANGMRALGEGGSKKAAEQDAAREVLRAIETMEAE